MSAYIIGSGVCLPDRVVTNEEFGEKLGIDPGRIYKSSGIKRRRWAEPGMLTSTLAARALAHAMADANITANQMDYLLFGTMTPDRFIPGSAPAVQTSAGLREIPCLDIRAACCNALYALQLAHALTVSGAASHVAICLAEIQSRYLDLSPESATLSMLFGDGASALIVSAEPRQGALEILDVHLATDGAFVDDLGMRCPGTEFGTAPFLCEKHAADFAPRMNGQSVILQASRRIVSACRALLARNHLTTRDIRWIVPHQANANLLAQIARGLEFLRADGVVSVIEDFGNTSSASMGIALDFLRRAGSIERGDYLLLPAFAAGFTWGAALCRA
ncbi:MAG TPA: ketoacyl-ACP synthase III [Pyrinomonadaceae bacterium]|nr:ketoacyl-ACP synthase III [Pyrinomonadaceae bacterium]